MGLFNSSKKVASRLIDIRADKWMSWDYIAETSERMKLFVSDIVIPKRATSPETFEEAMARMGLTEADLQARQHEFTRLLYFFMALALIIVVYALYMAFNGHMTTSLISFCLALYALTQAFRFHFWIFQIKNRKLGCTVKEWMNSKVNYETSTDLVADPESAKNVVKDSSKADE